MPASVQAISIHELWPTPRPRKNAWFMVLKGYIDDSYNKDRSVFALSSLLSTGTNWSRLERDWKVFLAGENKRLLREGRKTISRYHASDCSSLKNEFSDWGDLEQLHLVKGLFRILKTYAMDAVVYVLNNHDVRDVFPEETRGDTLAVAYSVLLRFLMIGIQTRYSVKDPEFKAPIALFHDRCPYDGVLLNAFNRMVEDEHGYARRFVSLTSVGWEHCVPLQPADLVAYECMKEIDRRSFGRKRRKSFDELLKIHGFGIHLRQMKIENLVEIRKIHESVQRSII